ncbi:MAG: hypothetical protein CMN78_03680 [Spirochaetales bacterium]|nr:hypothetical protein [Spirochaetales bacterium]
MKAVTILADNSCHITKARQATMRFNDMLREAQLGEETEAKGAISNDSNDEPDPHLSSTPENMEGDDTMKGFKGRIIDLLRHQAAEL